MMMTTTTTTDDDGDDDNIDDDVETWLVPRRFPSFVGIWRGARGPRKAGKSEVFP